MIKQNKPFFWMLAIAGALVFTPGCGGGENTADPDSEAENEGMEVPETAEGFNVLTEEERAEGWTLLFNGQDLSGWHAYNKDTITAWSVEDNAIARTGSGGDLVTDREYDNFELAFEWKVAQGSNSGVIYNVIESPDYADTYATGPEYQVIDDNGYADPLSDAQKAGANYDMHAPAAAAAKPVGEWNEGRIVVNGNQVEHWLNGQKVVEYEFDSDDWKQRVQNSKWKDFPGYGTGEQGRIALQDHGNPVWYRNIRIREL